MGCGQKAWEEEQEAWDAFKEQRGFKLLGGVKAPQKLERQRT